MSLAPDSAAAPTHANPRVLAGWKKLLAAFAGLLIRVWSSSLRVTLSPASRDLITAHDRPALFVLWHNRLFIAAHIARRFRDRRPLHCLISTSKDGAWLSAFFASMGLGAVRGSSSKGGREAAGALVRVLRDGNDAGITPDGPRGPRYVCKPGALIVARRGGARVIVLGINYESAWRLRSWDQFLLPRPFSRVRLVVREVTEADLHADDAPARLEAVLRELNP